MILKFSDEYVETDDEEFGMSNVPTKHFTNGAEWSKSANNCEGSDDDDDDDDDDDLNSEYEDELENQEEDDEETVKNGSKNPAKQCESSDKRTDKDLKFEFTIDMNKLKADMKKKSAKLLSKLSSSNNLVKNLIDNASKISIDNQIDAEINFKVDLNNFKFSKLEETSSKETKLKSKEQNLDLRAESLDELGEWLKSVEFRLDIKDSQDKNTILGIIEALKCKQKAINEEDINQTVENYVHFDLPVSQSLVAKLLSEYKSEKNNENECVTAVESLGLKEVTGKSSTSLRNTDWSFEFSLDDDKNKEDFSGPGPALLLQALTLASAGDGFDLERLETVGDSFLKQAVTVFLFFTYPNIHEGKLSYLRSKQVSNYNLYKLGRQKNLPQLIIANKFEPLDSWLPLHYETALSLNNRQNNMFMPNKSETQFDKYKDHVISDKSIADSVEAIIGAYLITSGPKAALQVMSWFGLKVLPKVKCEDGSEVLIDMPPVVPPLVNDYVKLKQLLDGYASFEACIGYTFNHPAYLLQAFTHSSYTYNTITDCYQRLEFLGDAILDYVITRYLYEDKRRHSPGELTDLRSALVNNNIFAYLAVKYEFYKFFKYLSPDLFTIVNNFVCNQKKRNDEFDLEEDVRFDLRIILSFCIFKMNF